MSTAMVMPWGVSGTVVDPNASIEELGNVTGFAVPIERRGVWFPVDEAGADPYNARIEPYEGYDVVFRRDPYHGNRPVPLSVVTTKYQITQPMSLLEFFRDLCEDYGYRIQAAGFLSNKKKYWCLAKLPFGGNVRGDMMEGYVMLSSSCDRSTQNNFDYFALRPACLNMIGGMIRRGGSMRHKVRHTSVVDFDAVKRAMGLIDIESEWGEFMRRLNNYANTPMTDPLQFLADVIGEDDIEEPKRPFERLVEVYSRGQGQDTDACETTAGGKSYDTLWAGVNAVTRYVDHECQARTSGHRLDSAWFGRGAALKARAVELADELVEVMA